MLFDSVGSNGNIKDKKCKFDFGWEHHKNNCGH